MSIYCDSSLLFKLYVQEKDSAAAVAVVAAEKPPLPISLLHEIEIRNSIRQRTFAKQITRGQAAIALSRFKEDMDVGLFQRVSMDWGMIFQMAEDLSHRFAEQMSCRSLDVLHISTALALHAEVFCTFDIRQRDLAREAGFSLR